LTFSPDGRLALSGGTDGLVCVWEVDTGKLLRSLQGHDGTVFSVVFSPDGRRILSVGGADNSPTDRRVRLWDVAHGEEVGHFDWPSNARPLHAAVSPDGRFAACSGGDKAVRLLWFSEAGQSQKPASDPDKGQLAIETSGFDLPIIVKQPDKLVTVIVPKVNKVAELPPGEYELELVGQPEDFRLSADKVTLAQGQTQTVSIQEVPLAKPPYEITELHRFEGHTSTVESVAFSPDGHRTLSGSQDKTVRLWDVDNRKLIRQFEGNTQNVFCVAFSPDGRQAVSCAFDKSLRLWEVETGRQIRSFTGCRTSERTVVFLPTVAGFSAAAAGAHVSGTPGSTMACGSVT